LRSDATALLPFTGSLIMLIPDHHCQHHRRGSGRLSALGTEDQLDTDRNLFNAHRIFFGTWLLLYLRNECRRMRLFRCFWTGDYANPQLGADGALYRGLIW